MTSPRVERNDDERAHFMVMLVDACTAARLARLPIEVTTDDGRHLRGVPEVLPRVPGRPYDEEPADAADVCIDGRHVDLSLVVSFAVLLSG